MGYNNSDDWVKKGLELFDSEKYDEALEVFEHAIEDGPENADVWYYKGLSLDYLLRYEEALDAYDKAINLGLDKPNLIDALYNRAIILAKLERYKEALELYDKIIESKFVYYLADAWNNKGIILDEFGRHKEALEAYNNAFVLQPKKLTNIFLWNNKGIVLDKLGRSKEALEAYTNALAFNLDELDDYDTYIRYNKGVVLDKLGKYDEALESFKKAIAGNNNFIDPYIAIVNLLLRRGVIDDASHVLEKAFNVKSIESNEPLNFKKSELWFLKGKISLENENYLDSSSYFKKSMSLHLDNDMPLLWNAYAKYLYAELYLSQNTAHYQNMILAIIRELEKTLDSNNDKIKPYTFYFLGYLYYKINDFLTALDKLKNSRDAIDLPDKNEDANYYNDLKKLCKSSNELSCHIWDYRVKSHWWSWWLNSPVNLKSRKTIFFVISGIIVMLFGIHPALSSLNINWNLYVLLNLFLISILISPSITKIKSSNFEIEMKTPPNLELSSAAIESMLQRAQKHDDVDADRNSSI